MRTRSSTQARSHAQKFFVKLQRRNEKLEDYLQSYDLDLMRQRMINPDADYEDTDSLNQSSVSKKREKKGNLKQPKEQPVAEVVAVVAKDGETSEPCSL